MGKVFIITQQTIKIFLLILKIIIFDYEDFTLKNVN